MTYHASNSAAFILTNSSKQIKWSALNSVIENMVFMFLGKNIFFGYGNPIEPAIGYFLLLFPELLWLLDVSYIKV